MREICLAHWGREEGEVRARELEALGFSVRYDPMDGGKLLRVLKKNPPLALVVDLSRSPAQGRDLAVALRIYGATRRVPLIMVGGDPEKIQGVRRILPDAHFTSWPEIGDALERALANPPREPVVPDSILAGYSGTPLPRKLGIRSGSRVLLVKAPEGFRETLGPLPPEARLMKRFNANLDLVVWFVRWGRELDEGIPLWASRVPGGGIWIAWPKTKSSQESDLTQSRVRKVGLEAGLVDYKIAAIDETWSALRFAVRKEGRS